MERDDIFVHTMNTKPRISIILTVLTALALSTTAQAQNLVVSNSAYPAVSGTHYENNGTSYAALTVSGSLGSFTGTNIILTGTAASGNGRIGAYAYNQGRIELHDSTIVSQQYGVYLDTAASGLLSNAQITSNVLNNDAAIYVNGQSHLSGSNVSVTVTTSGITVKASGSSMIDLTNSTLNRWVYATTGGTMNLLGGRWTGTSNELARADNANSVINIYNMSGTSSRHDFSTTTTGHVNVFGGIYECGLSGVGMGAQADGVGSVITGSGVSVTVDSSKTGVDMNTESAGLGARQGGSVYFFDSVIHTTGSFTPVVQIMNTNSRVEITNSLLLSDKGGLVQQVDWGETGTSTVIINGGTARVGKDLININTGTWGVSMSDIVIKGATLTSGGELLNNASFTSQVRLTLNNADARNAGGIIVSNSNNIGTTDVSVIDGSGIIGDVTNSGSGSLAVTITNSTLTGKTTVADAATLNLSLFDSGTWYMVDNSTLTNLTAAKTARVNFPAPTAAGAYHKLTVNNNLGGEGGTFAMHTDIAAGKADLLTIGGTASTGAHRITLTNANDNAVTGTESPLLLVQTAGGNATFTGTTTAGVYDYSVQNGAQLGNAFDLPDTNWYLYRAGLSNVGNAIINTSAMLGYDWFYSLDALYLRMGDVREENLTVTGSAGISARDEQRGQDARAPSGNLWLRARGYRLNADASLSGRPYNEYAYGLSAGADKAFHRNSNASTTLLGAFLDIGRIDRDFSGANNTGYTTSLSAGLYATYLRNNGWHADLVLKADRYKHHFDTTTADRLPVTGDYTNNALGASLEIGRRVQRADGWWVEPMVQAAYTWLSSATYRTAPANATLGVTLDTTRAAQYRALVRFGRRVQNSRWSPYGKFGVVRTDLTGGALHIDDGANTLFVPNADGWRVEFGAGTSYYINARSQLYFDYEYDRAPHYERPWALNLGYRYGW